MVLDIALRRPILLPRFLQAGGNDPRNAHWIGSKRTTEQSLPEGKPNPEEPPKQQPKGYRGLSSITLGEVDEAWRFYQPQLTESPHEDWIARNSFCLFDLVPRDGYPSAVFGRIGACYPTDGYTPNIKEIHLLLPHPTQTPDSVQLRKSDLLQARSYHVRVRIFATEEDFAELTDGQDSLLQHGFVPEFETSFLPLLELTEHNHSSTPWLNVISSRWYTALPDTVRAETREALQNLLRWNMYVFNYHPLDLLPYEIHSLNREFGFKDGFTPFRFFEPENIRQITQIVSTSFDRIFHVTDTNGTFPQSMR